MKRLLTFIAILFLTFSCNGQNKKDLRDMKIGELNGENLKKLFKSGLISESEAPLFATQLIVMIQDGIISDTMTYGQIIDLYSNRKNELNNVIAKEHDFGQDSVFIRTPMGDKFLLGMGVMSLEKLILRESKQPFPKKYEKSEYNTYITSGNTQLLSSAISSFIDSDMIAGLLAGNALIIIPELGIDLSKYRIGDIIEVGKNVKNSDEFTPFIDIINSML